MAPRLFVQVRLRRGPGAGGAGPVLGERVHQVARVGGERRARAPVLRQSAGGFEPEPRLRRRAAGAVGERRKLRAHARLRRRGGHRDGRGRGDRRPAIVPRLRVPRRRGRARRRGEAPRGARAAAAFAAASPPGVRRVRDYAHELRQHEPSARAGRRRRGQHAPASRGGVVHQQLLVSPSPAKSAAPPAAVTTSAASEGTPPARSVASPSRFDAGTAPRAASRTRHERHRGVPASALDPVHGETLRAAERGEDHGGALALAGRRGRGDELEARRVRPERARNLRSRAVRLHESVSPPVAVHLPLLQGGVRERQQTHAAARGRGRPRERPHLRHRGVRGDGGFPEETQRGFRRGERRRAPLGRRQRSRMSI